MVVKVPIVVNRIRKVPRHFSWIDHRLVRDRHIEQLNHAACALYLFLVTVGDAKGLSYYGDKSIRNRLCMDEGVFFAARAELIDQGLIAWQAPLYQVLSLDKAGSEPSARRANMDHALSFGDILQMGKEGMS